MMSKAKDPYEDRRFYPYFAANRREHALATWKEHLEIGKVDPEMIPFVERLWKVPWLMPFSSCCGHGGEKQAHIAMKIQLPYEEFFELASLFVVFYNQMATERGNKSRRGTPVGLGFAAASVSFYFVLHSATWDKEAEVLVRLMEEHTPSVADESSGYLER